jgi:hypothetical protein
MVGFWANLTGWRLFLTMTGSQHLSYTDYEDFLSQLIAAGIISPSQAAEVVTPYIGTIDPGAGHRRASLHPRILRPATPSPRPPPARRAIRPVPPGRVPSVRVMSEHEIPLDTPMSLSFARWIVVAFAIRLA